MAHQCRFTPFIMAVLGLIVPTGGFAQIPPSSAVLPTIEVIGSSPLPGSEIDREKVPANVQTLGAPDFDHATSPDLMQSIVRGVPGVSLGDHTGNPFQPDLNYRGFTASPVIGAPQGLAVYQNGVRVNEVFGDTVNWDFIPEMAINRMALVPNNPIFGLNALGGALSIEMKNGFTYQGIEAELRGGSFGRIGGSAQAGGQNGNIAAYVTADGLNDSGWRDASSSMLRRIYVDLGARGDQTEFHITFTGASNSFGATAAAPVELLNQRWSSVYTIPQTTQNTLAFITASASYKPTETLSLQGNVYYRGFWQNHVDGNGTSAQNQNCPDPNFLCFPDLSSNLQNLISIGGAPVPATGALNSSVLGEIDRTWTTTNSYGGSLQATSTSNIFGHDNHFVVGTSLDRGHVQFSSTSELATVNANQFPFVTGVGIFIDQPSGDVAPVSLLANTTYMGFYATNTFDVTSQLAVTGGGRFNIAQIQLQDQLGSALAGSDQYTRLNPVIGATYKLAPGITLYGGYSEANRAPTPLELGCADPTRPCLIDNFLISDPPLKQVVSHTYEVGLRGNLNLGDTKGVLSWTLGAFHIENTDDIINVASAVLGHGYFQNAGQTLRRGIEANAKYKWDRWTAYANYTYIDATFQSPLTLSSPNSPAADTNGNIFVVPGNHIPAVPAHRFKAGAEYQITDAWKFGADLNVVGSQYLIGDQSNQNPQVPAYWVVNLHTSYQVTKNMLLFGSVQNLFNQHYYVAGTFFQTDSFPYLNLTDPHNFFPGMPFAAYAGVRVTF